MTTFRQVVPNSIWNPSNARFEYNLFWLSPSSGIRSWFFSHTDGSESDSFKNFTIESIDNIRSVPSLERKEVTAITKTMDAETFNFVKSIMASNRVYSVDQNGNKTPVAMRAGNVVQDNTLKNFQLKIRFSFQENDILNV